MTSAVYQSDNFDGRVNLAANYISQGRNTSRTFDSCFEMGDGSAVALALVARARAKPDGRLSQNLWRYLSKDVVDCDIAKHGAVLELSPTKRMAKLRILAERLRSKCL
jgi:hypothetical protein